ncbi:MAG: hypothetical protein AAF488_17535, partial [Planctomycetota bacterium]
MKIRSCVKMTLAGVLLVTAVLGSRRVEGTEFVFTSRRVVRVNGRRGVADRAEFGKLLLRRSNGQIVTLVDASAPNAPLTTPVDVSDPDVSFDGTRVVFSGYSGEERTWRIYEVGINGGGLRQITENHSQPYIERHGEATSRLRGSEDLDPCYLPDGRICFVSTRYPTVAPDGRMRGTNLYVVNADGTDVHRITSERFGADTPAVDPTTGEIVYSRWWRSSPVERTDGDTRPVQPGSPGYGGSPDRPRPPGDPSGDPAVHPSASRTLAESDFPGVNSWFLARIRPDGTEMAMFSGFRLDREATQSYRPSFGPNGETFALFIPLSPRMGTPGPNGLRLYDRGPSLPQNLAGPQSFLRGREGVPLEHVSFASARPIDRQRLLVSASMRGTTEHDIFVFDRVFNTLSAIVAMPDAQLDAVPIDPRPLPPVLEDKEDIRPLLDYSPRTVEEAFSEGGSFTFAVDNIFFNADVDEPLPNAPPAIPGLKIEFFMAPQLTSPNGADEPILIESVEIPRNGK